MFDPLRPPPSLGQRRAPAIRAALAGYARNVALTPAQEKVLVQREAEETPLSATQRAIARLAISDYFSEIAPDAPSEDRDRLTRMAVPRMTWGDYSVLMRVLDRGQRIQDAKARRRQ